MGGAGGLKVSDVLNLEGHRVGVLFRGVITGTPVGVPLVDRMHFVCGGVALDWLYYYVLSENDGDVRLRLGFLYGDCDPMI